MPITLSYVQSAGKIVIAGLTISDTYTITKSGEIYSNISYPSSTSVTGITGVSSYTDYFLKAGTTYTIQVKNQLNVTDTFTQYVDYDDSFLINSNTKKNQQLSIVFDENISSFKPVRKDSLIETIGSKYPFIIRNASVNYKSMEFSGNITYFMDLENISGFGPSSYYTNYNQAFYIERNFRDWFEEWVNDGAPKLLKTPTEGLKIVRIHNLNFTPFKELGRLIYSFTCTITEIGDYSGQNLTRYKFISNSASTIFYLTPSDILYPGDFLYPLGD
jgi:hypothetical protein